MVTYKTSRGHKRLGAKNTAKSVWETRRALSTKRQRPLLRAKKGSRWPRVKEGMEMYTSNPHKQKENSRTVLDYTLILKTLFNTGQGMSENHACTSTMWVRHAARWSRYEQEDSWTCKPIDAPQNVRRYLRRVQPLKLQSFHTQIYAR